MVKHSELRNSDFYKDYQEINPALVLGLIVISFGFYIINWIFVKNKDFENIDHNAPDSKRGAMILMVIPFIWFFIYMVLKKLFFTNSESLFLGIIEIVGWGLILFLILKYLLDFCISFGKITKTNGLIWFIFKFLGIIGIVCSFLEFYYLSPLIFFIVISIPAMQSELNSHFSRLSMRKKGNIFYS